MDEFEKECRRIVVDVRDELMDYYTGSILNEDNTPANLYDYIDDNAQEYQYVISSDKEYRYSLIIIGIGGPYIYIDTGNKSIELYWGSRHASAALKDEVVD